MEQNETTTATVESVESQTVITCVMAVIKIEGQEFELEAVLAQDDKMLKTVLQPHFSSLENADITCDVKEGNSTLQWSKKRKPKADNPQPVRQSPFEMLCEADEQINPAIVLAEELMRKDIIGGMEFADIEEAEKTLLVAREKIEKIERHFAQLVKTPPQASRRIPIGGCKFLPCGKNLSVRAS